jgi:hypothetical protein
MESLSDEVSRPGEGELNWESSCFGRRLAVAARYKEASSGIAAILSKPRILVKIDLSILFGSQQLLIIFALEDVTCRHLVAMAP